MNTEGTLLFYNLAYTTSACFSTSSRDIGVSCFCALIILVMYDIYYLYFKLHRPLILILNNNIDLFLEIKYLDYMKISVKVRHQRDKV